MKTLSLVICLGLSSLLAAEDTPADAGTPVTKFVFEGQVTEVATEFSDTFFPGDIISGTLGIKEFARESTRDYIISALREYRDAILEPEFIIDRNHIQISGGSGRNSLNQDYHILQVADAEQGEAEGDFIKLFLLMTMSSVTEAKYTYAWLEIELTDASGEMVDGFTPPRNPPDFESATFTLSFIKEEASESVRALSGEITLFTELRGDANAKPSYDELTDIVYTLDDALKERDAYIQELLSLLEAANKRITSLEGKLAVLEAALAEAEGTPLALELERQNAVLRKQLQEATAEKAATADIIAALKRSETELATSYTELQRRFDALQKTRDEATAAESAKLPLPPMFARPETAGSSSTVGDSASVSARFISIPGVTDTPAEQQPAQSSLRPAVISSSPEATQDVAANSPVVLPAGDSPLLTPDIAEATQQQSALSPNEPDNAEEPRTIRRGPRR